MKNSMNNSMNGMRPDEFLRETAKRLETLADFCRWQAEQTLHFDLYAQFGPRQRRTIKQRLTLLANHLGLEKGGIS